MTRNDHRTCKHTTLKFDPSPHATVIGYERPAAQQRAAATTRFGHVKNHQNIEVPDSDTYPAPLVLPGDDLAIDPTYPPQSLRAWLREKERNPVTLERKTIYVARHPDVDSEVEFVRKWCIPRTTEGVDGGTDLSPLDVMDVVRYLQAFYHGMNVKLLPASSAFRFAAWDDDDDIEPPVESPEPPPKRATKKGRKAAVRPKPKPKPRTSKTPSFIALQTSTEATRIRTRHNPGNSSSSALYPSQLNLSDLLDAAIALPPPPDVYALLLLVNHDLYEDEDDDFICGRAYGGSRVAVVSTARYDPRLDALQSVHPDGEQHAWPGSCCAAFIDEICCRAGTVPSLTGASKPGMGEVLLRASAQPASPMMKAIIAAEAAAQSQPPSKPHTLLSLQQKKSSHQQNQQKVLWLSRVCKTASHELGHCFGIDHCIYYACVMQGTASLAEDARQPPYLCPVDEMKLGVAVAVVAAASTSDLITTSSSSGPITTSTSTTFGSIANPVVIDVDETEIEIETPGAETRAETRAESRIVIRAGRKRGRDGDGDGMVAGNERKVKAKAKAEVKRGGDGGENSEVEMGRLEIWKRERRERMRGFCQEIMQSEGKEAVGLFWWAFDAWLEGVGETGRRRNA